MKLLLALIALLFFVGCDEPVYTFNFDQKADFSQLKTYSWVDSQNENDALLNHWLFRQKVMMVSNKILKEKGYTLVTDTAAPVDFHCVLLGEIKSDTAIVVKGGGSGAGYGVGYGSYGYGGYGYGPSYAGSYGSSTYNSSGGFDENGGYGGYGHYGGGARPTSVAVGVGTGGGEPRAVLDISNNVHFLFDIVDVKAQSLVWRTTVNKLDAGEAKSAQASDDFVRKMVATILENYPPKQ